MSNIFQNANMAKIIAMVQELNNPKSLAKANTNPIEFFAGYGVTLPANADYEIYLNNGAYYYFVLPLSSDSFMNDEQLLHIQAGNNGKASCKGTLTTLLCFSCFSCPVEGSALTLTSLATLSSGQFGK